jgi:capsular polysaccharide transport system permease protein
MLKDLKTQFNVLKALTIHHLQGQMSSYRYGFAWMLLEPLIYIAGFRLMRQFFGNLAPPSGMTPLMFYVLGVLPLYLAFDAIKGFSTVGSQSKLLAFPRVTPVDVAISANLSSFCIYFVLFWIVVLPVSIYEHAWPPQNIMTVMLALLAGWMLGMAFSFCISGAFRVFPPMKQFVSYLTFGLRIASGMFFCITMIPLVAWPYLRWNPLLQVTELMRDGWFESYVSPIASPGLVLEWLLGLLLLGLSVERFMRRVPYL